MIRYTLIIIILFSFYGCGPFLHLATLPTKVTDDALGSTFRPQMCRVLDRSKLKGYKFSVDEVIKEGEHVRVLLSIYAERADIDPQHSISTTIALPTKLKKAKFKHVPTLDWSVFRSSMEQGLYRWAQDKGYLFTKEKSRCFAVDGESQVLTACTAIINFDWSVQQKSTFREKTIPSNIVREHISQFMIPAVAVLEKETKETFTVIPVTEGLSKSDNINSVALFNLTTFESYPLYINLPPTLRLCRKGRSLATDVVLMASTPMIVGGFILDIATLPVGILAIESFKIK